MSPYFDLFDYRVKVFDLYRQRNLALQVGRDPAATLEEFRASRDALFGSHPQSALRLDRRQNFSGLQYFPYDAGASVPAIVEPPADSPDLSAGASSGTALPMVRVATLHFRYMGWEGRLSLFWIDVYGGGLFLPYRDARAPAETYGGGRYLFDTVKGSDFLRLPDEDGATRILLDFNYGYNPSCAYDARWACPLAPRENWLSFPIRAGERLYRADAR